MKKLLLFDIDGTLLLTGGTGIISFERAFQELYGIANSWGQVIPDGKTDQRIFGEIFQQHFAREPTTAELEDIFLKYIHHFGLEINITPGFRIMPGIAELLARLTALSHVTLGIATGNIAEVSDFKLRRGNLHPHFCFMSTASDSHDRPTLVKYAIERGQALTGPLEASSVFVIGDAVADILAAKKNGVRSVAVATGSTSKEELSRHSPDYILEDLSNPEALLDIIS